MRKKLKSVFMLLASILLCGSNMLSTITIKADVTNLEDTGYWHTGQAQNPANPAQYAWFDHQTIEKIHVEQGVGVCSEPWEVIGDWGGYVTSTIQGVDIANIWYYAYVNTNQSHWNYAVGQLMVWEYLGYTPTAHNIPDYEKRKAEVNSAIAKMKVTPSFHNQEITLNIRESKTLTDTNGVLSDFKGKESIPEGITVTRSGNKLTITANANASETSTYRLGKIRPEMIGQSLVHKKPGGQDIMYPLRSDPGTFKLAIHVNKYGSLKLTKQDEDGTYVPNTSFKLSKHQDMSSPVGTYTTGEDGTVTVDQLLPQKYYIQEVVVPNHLVLDKTVHEVTVEPNKTASFNAHNDWKKGKVQIRKVDKDSKKQVAGATYAIFDKQNQELQRLVTKASGYSISGYLRVGEYYVQEVIAPKGYVLDKTKYPVTISDNGQTIDVTGSDKRQTAALHLTKQDSVTGTQPQGEATLQGAVYELRAKENILDPADRSVKYAKGALVATLTTNEQAKASKTGLYLGNYVLQEKTPSEGYTLDTTKYDISIDYAGEHVEVVTKNQTVKERVIAQAFQIIKISDNGTGEADTLNGAEFTIKAKKDVIKAGSWEAAPIAKNANGKTAAVMVTDKTGHAVSEELPKGTYIIRETKTPDEHMAVKDFEVIVTEDSREPQVWRIMNDEAFEGALRIVKQDKETGKTVLLPNAEFKVFDVDKKAYVKQFELFPFPHYTDTWKTNDNGEVYLGDLLHYGDFELREVKAPNGYLLDTTPVPFKISQHAAMQVLPEEHIPVFTVVKQDRPVKGRIRVYKEGEVLTAVKQDENGDHRFVYETRKLKDAVFEVKAAQDILSADNQGDILYHKGDLVDTITTDASGEARTKLLPLGNYQVSEKTAPNGFTHSEDVREVELVYKDQHTAIVFGDAGTYENERQRVDVQAVKKDADDRRLLAGAEITLYANKDVYDYDGDVIVKAGEKIESVVTDEHGKAGFSADLPNDLTPEYGGMPTEEEDNVRDMKMIGDRNSLFYATETKAPAGYASGQETRYYLDTGYTSQDEPVLKFKAEFRNETTKVEISKVDITNEKELPGATLQIKTKAGKVLEEWVSTDQSHLIEKLPVGNYVLSEKIPANGYTTANDIPFEVKDTGEIQKVVMKDDVTKLRIIKTDEEGKLLPGNRLAILDRDGRTIDEWTTDEKPHDITKLTVGEEYTLRELKAADGYSKAKDVNFIVRDTEEIQTIDMSNKQTEMYFSKVDETGEKELPGAKLQIIDKDGNIVDQWTSTEEQHTITGLTEGQTYVMKEISAPYGYEIAEEITFTAGDGQKVTMKDKMIRSYIKVNKVDHYDHQDILKAAEFTLYSDAACTKKIRSVKTDTKNGIALFDDLTYGTYFIKETKAPAGYQLSDEVVKVTIDDAWVNGDDKLRTIVYADRPLPTSGGPNTGDHTSAAGWIFLLGVSTCTSFFLLRRKHEAQ